MDFNNISKRDLNLLHTLILTLIKINRIDLLSLGEKVDNKISLLNNNDLWYLYDINGNDYIIADQKLEFACQIIIRALTNSKEEEEATLRYFYKLLLLNIPTAELVDYLNYYNEKTNNKSR